MQRLERGSGPKLSCVFAISLRRNATRLPPCLPASLSTYAHARDNSRAGRRAPVERTMQAGRGRRRV